MKGRCRMTRETKLLIDMWDILHRECHKVVTEENYDAIKKSIKALEQEPCEDEVYEKDLNGLKEQIFKEGNTLISKQDLLERFVEIDNEYKNSHWNLLQILTNIDILIGKEPCEDAVSRKAVIDTLDRMDKVLDEDRTVETYKGLLKECYKVLTPVNPQKIGHWIIEKWNNKEHYSCSSCQHVVDYEPCYHYCPYCGAKMVEPQERSDKE